MPSFLKPYAYLIDVVLILAIICTFAYGVHIFALHNQALGAERVQIEWDRANEVAADAQRKRELQFQQEKDDALNQAQKSIQAANAGAVAAADAGRMLHTTVETLVAKSAGDTSDATRKYTAALAAVFEECTNKYRELGREAQGHADDSLMYQKAWPK